MVPLTGQNTINDMVDRINEVAQEIENVAVSNANAVQGPASSVVDQIMAFSDTTGKNAKAVSVNTCLNKTKLSLICIPKFSKSPLSPMNNPVATSTGIIGTQTSPKVLEIF